MKVKQKNLPKISIITPSYNQGNYLTETIDSVISQGYANYELIIIDAGSTDETLEVIRKYESWITYWVSEPDRGQSHAIQKGLEVATGDIINWLNSDDLLAPGAFNALAREFDLERYDVLCGNCDYFLNDLDHLDLRSERMGLGATVGDTFIRRKINQPSTFFKASVIKQLGIDEQFHFTMDLDLWYRYLLRAGQSRIVLSDTLLTYFRLHESSKTVALSPRFEGDVRKVFYNVLYSLNQPDALLAFMRRAVPDADFKPTRYQVGIPVEEISSFIRVNAWAALIYYNEIGDTASARESIKVARRYGQPFNLTLTRQFIKHYLLPRRLISWMGKRTAYCL
ncbi:glycosyltransferase family 2 protein [Hymenobacter humi]|uniref:Glycosyltransferase family 2 protein n=1 Tax=Hymenobacter humi TaxID=1411620 RepID=A0ABW2UB61_9BACT